jgi:hypothetical protein
MLFVKNDSQHWKKKIYNTINNKTSEYNNNND